MDTLRHPSRRVPVYQTLPALHPLKQNVHTVVPAVTLQESSKPHSVGGDTRESTKQHISACLRDHEKTHHKGFNVRSAGF